MNRMRIGLMLAFLPGAALLFATVWTAVPPEWFAALYGTGVGTGTANNAAEALLPCRMPRITCDTATPVPALSPTPQRKEVASPPAPPRKVAAPDRKTPQQDRRAVMPVQRRDEPDDGGFSDPRMHERSRIGHAPPEEAQRAPWAGAVYQPAWLRRPERHVLTHRWSAANVIPLAPPSGSGVWAPMARPVSGLRSAGVLQGTWTVRHLDGTSRAGRSHWRRSGQRGRDEDVSKAPVI